MSNLQQSGLIREQIISALAPILAVTFPIVIPTTHIILFSHIWSDKSYKVDRQTCTCSCWDTVFKGGQYYFLHFSIFKHEMAFWANSFTGPYEDGVARYKHIYFNAAPNTFKIWALTVAAVILLYECLKYLFKLIRFGQLRCTMALLFLISLHSHYYAWWAHFNYWNDDFYPLWSHQMFYTVTELICTAMAVLYLDRRKELESVPLVVIGAIGLFHVIHGSLDQFIQNVVMGDGRLHQVK